MCTHCASTASSLSLPPCVHLRCLPAACLLQALAADGLIYQEMEELVSHSLANPSDYPSSLLASLRCWVLMASSTRVWRTWWPADTSSTPKLRALTTPASRVRARSVAAGVWAARGAGGWVGGWGNKEKGSVLSAGKWLCLCCYCRVVGVAGFGPCACLAGRLLASTPAQLALRIAGLCPLPGLVWWRVRAVPLHNNPPATRPTNPSTPPVAPAGKYVTGDINEAYLRNLEEQGRGKRRARPGRKASLVAPRTPSVDVAASGDRLAATA